MPPLYRAFAPDVLLVQLGADGYFGDPLAHLLLSTRAYETAAQRLRALTEGRLVAVGGGGYDVEATPRIWALELVTLAGLDLHLARLRSTLASLRPSPPGATRRSRGRRCRRRYSVARGPGRRRPWPR